MTKLNRLYKKKLAQIKPDDWSLLPPDMKVVYDQMSESRIKEPGHEQQVEPSVKELLDVGPSTKGWFGAGLSYTDGRPITDAGEASKAMKSFNANGVVSPDAPQFGIWLVELPYNILMDVSTQRLRHSFTMQNDLYILHIDFGDIDFESLEQSNYFNDIKGDINVVDELDNSLDTTELSMQNEFPAGEGDSSQSTRPGEMEIRRGQMSHGDLPEDMQVVNDQMQEQPAPVEVKDLSNEEPYIPTVGDARALMRFGTVDGKDVFILERVGDGDAITYYIDGIGEFDVEPSNGKFYYWPLAEGNIQHIMEYRLNHLHDSDGRADIHYEELGDYNQPQTPYLQGSNFKEMLPLTGDDIDLINYISQMQQSIYLDPGRSFKLPSHYRVAAGKGAILALIPTKEARDQIVKAMGDRLHEAPEDLHITLAYLGKNLSDDDINKVESCLESVCPDYEPLECKMQGLGVFDHEEDGNRPFYASIDAVGMAKLRTDLVDAIEKSGVKIEHKYDFTPHMTLGYVDVNIIELVEGSPGVSWTSNEVVLMNGGKHMSFKLGKIEKEAQGYAELPLDMQVVYDSMNEMNPGKDNQLAKPVKVEEIDSKFHDCGLTEPWLATYYEDATSISCPPVSNTFEAAELIRSNVETTIYINIHIPGSEHAIDNDLGLFFSRGVFTGFGTTHGHSEHQSIRNAMSYLQQFILDDSSLDWGFILDKALHLARPDELGLKIANVKAQIKPDDVRNLSPDMQVVMDDHLENGYVPEVLTDKKVFEELNKKRQDEYNKPTETRGRSYATHNIINTTAGRCLVSTEAYVMSAYFIDNDTLFVVQKDSSSGAYSNKKTYSIPTIRKSTGQSVSSGMSPEEYVKYITGGRSFSDSKSDNQSSSSIATELANYLAQFVTGPMTNAMRPQIGQELHKILHLAQIKREDLSTDMQVIHDQMLENEPGNKNLEDTDMKIEGPQIKELPDQYPGQAPYVVSVVELGDTGRSIATFNDSGKMYTDMNDSVTIVHTYGTINEPFGHDANDPYDVAYMATDWPNMPIRNMTYAEAIEWVDVMYPNEPYRSEVLEEILPLFKNQQFNAQINNFDDLLTPGKGDGFLQPDNQLSENTQEDPDLKLGGAETAQSHALELRLDQRLEIPDPTMTPLDQWEGRSNQSGVMLYLGKEPIRWTLSISRNPSGGRIARIQFKVGNKSATQSSLVAQYVFDDNATPAMNLAEHFIHDLASVQVSNFIPKAYKMLEAYESASTKQSDVEQPYSMGQGPLGVNFDADNILDLDKDAIGLPDNGLNENVSGDMNRLDQSIPRDPSKEDLLYR